MTTKDNPINLYAVDSLTVQPLDFTVLSETAVTPVTHMETTETLYKLSYTVCVKADSSESHQLFISLSARECECRYKRVKAEVFIQDPFNPVLFTEDSERYVDVSNIVCALTSYNHYTVKISSSLKKVMLFTGADPGCFLGGGALVSCSTSAPINHIYIYIYI